MIMPSHPVIRIIALCLSVLWTGAPCQGTDPPIREWIRQLSIREDIHFRNLQDVTEAIAQLDSGARCEAFSRLEDMKPRSKRFHIRINLLKSSFIVNLQTCPEWQSRDLVVRDALRLAYELNDTVLIAEVNRHMVNFY